MKQKVLNQNSSRNKNTVSKVAKLSDMEIIDTDYTDYKIRMLIVLKKKNRKYIQGTGN